MAAKVDLLKICCCNSYCKSGKNSVGDLSLGSADLVAVSIQKHHIPNPFISSNPTSELRRYWEDGSTSRIEKHLTAIAIISLAKYVALYDFVPPICPGDYGYARNMAKMPTPPTHLYHQPYLSKYERKDCGK
jgi:hypothetical protein